NSRPRECLTDLLLVLECLHYSSLSVLQIARHGLETLQEDDARAALHQGSIGDADREVQLRRGRPRLLQPSDGSSSQARLNAVGGLLNDRLADILLDHQRALGGGEVDGHWGLNLG